MGIVTTIAPVALALIMLGLGASLTVKDFTRVAQNPKDFFMIMSFVLSQLLDYYQLCSRSCLGSSLGAASHGYQPRSSGPTCFSEAADHAFFLVRCGGKSSPRFC